MSKFLAKPIYIPKNINLSVNFPFLLLEKKDQKWIIQYPSSICLQKKQDFLYFIQSEVTNVNLGLWYRLTKNLIFGLSQEYTVYLSLKGLGFKVQKENNTLNFRLGFSHISYKNLIPFVRVDVYKNSIIRLSSISKELLGLMSSRIKNLKEPDIYKGKGILYRGENLNLKTGKRS